MISSLELNLAYISERRSPRLFLKSLKVLLWNSEYNIWYISYISFGRRVSVWYSFRVLLSSDFFHLFPI